MSWLLLKPPTRTLCTSNFFDGELAMFGWLKSPKLLKRAEIAAKQMRYFRLFSQKGSLPRELFRRSNIFDKGLATFGWPKSPKLLERAEIAARQMRYFRLFSQKGSFEGLGASAKRAGFEMIYKDAFGKVAGFHWAADSDPDFTFFVSFGDPKAVLVTADSYGDISGLMMTSISNTPNIIVEAKPWLPKHEFGRNAHLFRKMLLTFPEFDAAAEKLFSRFQI
jgi:hypothetical protein